MKENQKAVLSFYQYLTPDDRKELVAAWIRQGETLRPQFDDITMSISAEGVPLQPGSKVVHQFMLYHGPVKAALLGDFSGDKAVSEALVDRYVNTLRTCEP